jgi:hypothetical protein
MQHVCFTVLMYYDARSKNISDIQCTEQNYTLKFRLFTTVRRAEFCVSSQNACHNTQGRNLH